MRNSVSDYFPDIVKERVMIINPTQFYHIPNRPTMNIEYGKVTIDTTGYELPDMLTIVLEDDGETDES